MSAIPLNQTTTVQDLSGQLRLVPAKCVDEQGCLMRSRLLGIHPELDSITDAEILDFIWNNLDGGNAIVAPNGTILAVNRRFAEWMRMPASEIEGKHFEEITLRDDIEADSRALAEVLEGKRDEYTMNKHYCPRGEAPFMARLRVLPWVLKDSQGSKVLFLHSQVDKLDAKGMPLQAMPDIFYVERWTKQNWKAVAMLACLCAISGSMIFKVAATLFPALQPAADALNGATP